MVGTCSGYQKDVVSVKGRWTVQPRRTGNSGYSIAIPMTIRPCRQPQTGRSGLEVKQTLHHLIRRLNGSDIGIVTMLIHREFGNLLA